MKPSPNSSFSPPRQRQHSNQRLYHNIHPTHQHSYSHNQERHQHGNHQEDQDPSRGRGRLAHPNSGSTRRKGNPQSPSESIHRSTATTTTATTVSSHSGASSSLRRDPSSSEDSSSYGYESSRRNSSSNSSNLLSSGARYSRNQSSHPDAHSSSNSHPTLSTPLATLSTVLTTAKRYHTSSIATFRATHQLQRDAHDRAAKASEALRLAQAEYENAKMAEDYANQEFDRATREKEDALQCWKKVEKEVVNLAEEMKGQEVRLVGLTQAVGWNGRGGRVVKMIMEGEDVGRWKIRLDCDWRERGGDPDGRDGRESTSGHGNGGEPQHVVAKAENLEMMEGSVPISKLEPLGISKSQSRSGSEPEPHHDQPGQYCAKDSPPRRVIKVNDGWDETSDHRHSSNNSNKHRDLYKPQAHHPHSSGRSKHQSSQSFHSNSQNHPPNDPPTQHHSQYHSTSDSHPRRPSPRHRNFDEISLSSAFSNMLMSPVSFEPATFTPIPASITGSVHNNSGVCDQSIVGSLFDETTSLDQEATYSSHNNHNGNVDNNHNSSNKQGGQHYDNRTTINGPYPTDFADDSPTIFIMSHGDGSDDSNDMNLSLTSPPQCIGVRGAATYHANGVYFLANNAQTSNPQHSSSSSQQTPPAPPLYFKDGPPTRLDDGRFYDMCILRIDCPDSPDHVIWFIAKVDTDPNCLDVKFSDCYYYCRLLRRSMTGTRHGDEQEDSGFCPPQFGWKVPRVPPGVSLDAASTGPYSTSENGNGYGDAPRPAGSVKGMMSPGVESQFSKYSI